MQVHSLIGIMAGLSGSKKLDHFELRQGHQDDEEQAFLISSSPWREQMSLPRLWTSGQELASDPFRAIRREMENALRAFDQSSPSPSIGAGAPAINVAETNDAFEVTAELPGVDEKDINISLDDNQLVISGEKKAESTKEEKDWHIEERSYGSFYRSMSLPFEPEDGAVEAHFDKGVLHITIKKPAKAVKATKTINIKTGAPPSTTPVSNKAAAPNKAA